MGKFIANKVKVIVNGATLSGWAHSTDTPSERDRVDVSGFNANATREFLPGTEDQTVTIQFRQDFSTVHAVLSPLYESGTQFGFSLQPDMTAGTDAANPILSGSASLYTYNGLAVALGEVAEVSAEFKPAPNSRFTWGTA